MTTARVRPVTFLRPPMVGFLTLLMLGAVPTAASAQAGVRRWLEKLSGPGPFTSGVFYIAPACYGYRPKKKEDQPKKEEDQNNQRALGQGPVTPPVQPAKKQIVPARRPMRQPRVKPPDQVWTSFGGEDSNTAPPEPEEHARLFPAWECAKAYGDMPNWYFYYEFGFDNAGQSNLRYADSNGTVAPQVGIQTHIVGFTFSTHPAIEAGAGLGGIRFDPNFGSRDAFWRFAVQPVRVHFRPAAIWTDDARLQAFMVTTETLLVVGRLTDANFGALPGTYSESNEMVTSFSLTFDLIRFFFNKNE